MSAEVQKYDSNGGAVWAGIRDLNDKSELPYDELRDEDRLDGRTVLITGATSGLGLATARELAARGARLLVAARREAAQELSSIREAGDGTANVQLLRADMADLASIRRLVSELADAGERIDVCISNAAVVPSGARRTVDGFEEMLQVNALAPALLMTELLKSGVIPNDTFAGNGLHENAPPEAKASSPRIVVVASEAHRSARALDLDRLRALDSYSMAESTPRYGWTKLLLMAFTRELGRRLAPEGRPDVAVHALCPGPIASNIAREAPSIARPFARLFFRIFFQSPAVAARPVVYLAASERIGGQTGLYQFLMRRREPSDLAESPDSGRAVWNAFMEIYDGNVRLRA